MRIHRKDKKMHPDKKTAELALKEAENSNPGQWADHVRYVAKACENIAARCPQLAQMGEGGANLYFSCIYDTGYKHFHRNV